MINKIKFGIFMAMTLAISTKAMSNSTSDNKAVDLDSTKWHKTIDQVIVKSSNKETHNPWTVPSSISIFTPNKIEQNQIKSIKQLSGLVPNLYIPDYGSRMTSAVYLRGIGARSSGQSVGFYVDNIPVMDKSAFDIDMLDIQHIEVLRGPQGTLYGRNAMGGIINLYTLSPLDYTGTRASIGVANYGGLAARASHYMKIGKKIGLAVGANYNGHSGYYANLYTGKRVDDEKSAGANIKLQWIMSPTWQSTITASYNYTDQGAFAYGLYDKNSKTIQNVSFNDPSRYLRNVANVGLRFQNTNDKFVFSSNTGYQYLNDDMKMDQDFSVLPIFTINQRQLQNAINQEFTIKSNTSSNYQWSFGTFAFYSDLTTDGDVAFGEFGVKNMLQAMFDKMPPSAPKIIITDTKVANPGTYKTPTFGVSAFHQSTFNNLITKGLSLTIGIRADYERQWLNYNTSMSMNIKPIHMGPITMDKISALINGGLSQDYIQILPKVSLKYECSKNVMTYITASKGHKAGGYNVQMFSEVIQKKMNPMAKEPNIDSIASYKPEITWNYEAGTRFTLFNGRVMGEFALFYMDIRDVQLTKFVNGGSGRILTNAGKGRSCGAEIGLNINAAQGLDIDINYGYNSAKFTEYDGGTDKAGNKIDYSGNFIPYTPRHTASLGVNYNHKVYNRWISSIGIGASANGSGPFFWNEENTLEQPFYALLNARAWISHKQFTLEFWGKNLLNQKYGAFYFESFGKSFMQQGKPTTVGVTLSVEF